MSSSAFALPTRVLRRSLEEDEHYGGEDTRYHNDSFVEDTDSNIFGTYERGCQISNDPPGDGDDSDHGALPALTTCNLTAYECRNSSIPSRNTGMLIISFDYELHYNPQIDVNRVLSYYEELSLDHLATELGLKDCEAVHASRHRRRYRRLLLSNETQALVSGLSLFPRDRPDPRYEQCVVLVGDAEVSADSVCVPTQGELTLFTAPNPDGSDWSVAQTEQLRSSVLQEIQRSMDQDLFVTPRAIEKIEFVGNRTALEWAQRNPTNSTDNFTASDPYTPPVQTSTSTQNDGSRMSTVMVGILAAAAVLVLLVLAAVMVTVRWRSQRGKAAANDDPATLLALPPEKASVAGSLANRDSLALVPQRLRGIPLVIEKKLASCDERGSDDPTAEVTSWASTPSPPRTTLLLSPNGRDASLQPPSRFVARHNATGFDPVMLGWEAPTGSIVGYGGSLSGKAPSLPSSDRGAGRRGVARQEGVEATYSYDSFAGTRMSFEKEMELSDSESDTSARRTLQMT